MKIDIKTEKCLYITIDDHTYYIDNSTNEQIITIYNSKEYKRRNGITNE